jgi:hypothetical protein
LKIEFTSYKDFAPTALAELIMLSTEQKNCPCPLENSRARFAGRSSAKPKPGCGDVRTVDRMDGMNRISDEN